MELEELKQRIRGINDLRYEVVLKVITEDEIFYGVGGVGSTSYITNDEQFIFPTNRAATNKIVTKQVLVKKIKDVEGITCSEFAARLNRRELLPITEFHFQMTRAKEREAIHSDC